MALISRTLIHAVEIPSYIKPHKKGRRNVLTLCGIASSKASIPHGQDFVSSLVVVFGFESVRCVPTPLYSLPVAVATFLCFVGADEDDVREDTLLSLDVADCDDLLPVSSMFLEGEEVLTVAAGLAAE